MWPFARTLRLKLSRAQRFGLTTALATALLIGCGSGTGQQHATLPVLTQQCASVESPIGISLDVQAPADGTLLVSLEEHGISVVASMDGDAGSSVESPVERIGTLRLLSDTARGRLHKILVRTEDSPGAHGRYCMRVDLIERSDAKRRSAELAFFAAGRATHRHEWPAAFESFLSAARRFGGLSMPGSAGDARLAMAELAYLRLDRKRDSYALAAEARDNLGESARPFIRGEAAAVQAKALLDMPGMDIKEVDSRVTRLQSAARRDFDADEAGKREIPRLDVMAGFLAYRLNAFAEARARFADAARSCRDANDWECYATASQDLALLEFDGRNYSLALSTFADALSALPPGLNPKLSADIWNNYGTLQGMRGLFSDSERSLGRSMREYARIGDCQGVRRNLARIGYVMAQLGSLSDSMSSLQRAASLDCASLYSTLQDQTSVSRTASAIETTRRAGLPGGGSAWCARPLDSQGLAIENKLIVFDALISLADTLMLQGDAAAAKRCLEAADPYAATAQSRMRLAVARGEALLDRQSAAAARASFQQSIRIAEQAGISPAYEAYGLAKLGVVKSDLLAGQARQAIPEGMSALSASLGRGDLNQTVAALRLLAQGYRELRQPAEAAGTLHTAANLIEAVPIDELDGEKRATFLASQYTVFAELTDLYASAAAHEPSFTAKAFSISERGRARSLRYAVTQAERDASAPEATSQARYDKLLQRVVKLAESAPVGDQRGLVERLGATLHELEPDRLLDQQQLLPALRQLHATLVEYAIGTRDMFAFVADERGLRVVRLGDRGSITNAAADLHDRLLDPESPTNEVHDSARRLAELVLWPITSQLTDSRLIIVPDDGLHTVPFNILPWSNRESDRLVLQHAEVSVAPSALFLTRVRPASDSHSRAPRIELLGDPVFRIADWRHECTESSGPAVAGTLRSAEDWTESLPRLPGSRAEVQMVARLSRQARPESHVEVFLGCAAVPSALRRAASGHVDLLHIATHARVDAQRPRLSALALTPEHADGDSPSAFGLLDILRLKLDSNLVVLSACETSRGRLLPGEGVLGPAQAFLQAGASAVLASYWRVDDRTTSRFMEDFYKYLMTDRLPAATALRKAQLDAAEHASPHDWAAFSLYGWPDSSI